MIKKRFIGFIVAIVLVFLTITLIEFRNSKKEVNLELNFVIQDLKKTSKGFISVSDGNRWYTLSKYRVNRDAQVGDSLVKAKCGQYLRCYRLVSGNIYILHFEREYNSTFPIKLLCSE